MTTRAEPSEGSDLIRAIGLFLGPLAAVAIYLLMMPKGAAAAPAADAVVLTKGGCLTLAVGAWLAIWWMTEAIALEAAALLPLVVFPIAGVANMKAAAAPYADEVVFLFLGGMIIGVAMEKWGLHRRVALGIMLLIGTRPAALIGGLMCATAFISMWVSNTAAAIMMLPIALGVVSLAHEQHRAHTGQTADAPHDRAAKNFAIASVLAVAWAASMGGVGTLIGTPPNGVMAAFIAERVDAGSSEFTSKVTFTGWAGVGMPIMLIVLPAGWLLLMLIFPFRGLKMHGARHMLTSQWRALGPVSRGEFAVIGVFVFVSLLWIFRLWICKELDLTTIDAKGRTVASLTDAGIAILGAMLLFIIPVRATKYEFALDWKTASKLPWGILLLFGSGLSLAAAIEAHKVDVYIGRQLSGLDGCPPVLIVFIVALAATFISEIGSNTAVATVMMPVVAKLAQQVGANPYELCYAAALGASLAFMLPCGTPPNAIAYATGHLRIGQMVKAGLAINIVCCVVITVVVHYLAPAIGAVPAMPVPAKAVP